MKKRLLAGLGVIGFVLAFAPPALACSCAEGDPRARLEEADAAFIGRLVSRDEPTPGPFQDSGSEVTYHFKVDERVKGPLGSTVDVESPNSGASCGFEVAPGEEVGIFLSRRGDEWTGGLCSQIEPEKLRRAAKDRPPPDGEGPLALLLGGSTEAAELIGLDDRGRTLHYGDGDAPAALIGVCPGSRYSVEVGTVSKGKPYRDHLVVRDLDTFKIVRDVTLEEFDHPAEEYHGLRPNAIQCRHPAADNVLVFASNSNDDRRPDGRLVEVRGNAKRVVWKGQSPSAGFANETVYLGTPAGKLLAMDVGRWTPREVATLPVKSPAALVVSPDDEHLAGRGAVGENQAGFVVDLSSGKVMSHAHADGADIMWHGNDRVVSAGGGDAVRVFDTQLKMVAEWSGWSAGTSVVVDGALYGVGWGTFSSAPVMTGPAEVLRKFDSPQQFALVAVPPRLDPAAATPSPVSTAPPAAAQRPRAESTPAPETSPTPTPQTTPASFAQPSTTPARSSRSAVPGLVVGCAAAGVAMTALALRRRPDRAVHR